VYCSYGKVTKQVNQLLLLIISAVNFFFFFRPEHIIFRVWNLSSLINELHGDSSSVIHQHYCYAGCYSVGWWVIVFQKNVLPPILILQMEGTYKPCCRASHPRWLIFIPIATRIYVTSRIGSTSTNSLVISWSVLIFFYVSNQSQVTYYKPFISSSNKNCTLAISWLLLYFST
jgi:hypothetical protein